MTSLLPQGPTKEAAYAEHWQGVEGEKCMGKSCLNKTFRSPPQHI